MHTITGELYSAKEIEDKLKKGIFTEADLKYIKELGISPTKAQMLRKPPKIGRNEPCGCGSGKKFKKCCLKQSGE